MKLTLKDFVDKKPIESKVERKVIKEEKVLSLRVLPAPLPEVPSPPPTTHPSNKTLVDRASEHIKSLSALKEQQSSFEQPSPPLVSENLSDIVQKLKYLESWVGKISAHGPGGGAGVVINLDHPVKLVTSNYTINRRDYYVGVNSPTTVTLTLPDSIGFPGRKIIIKDESGNCASNPIVVNGTVDNDPGGFILQQNNGGIQLIYREGWRII